MNENEKQPTKIEAVDEISDSVINDLNFDHINFCTISGTDINNTDNEASLEKQDQQDIAKFTNFKNNNNNHHVVPIGVIIVLTTIYLGMTNVQKCLVNCIEHPQNTDLKTNNENIIKYVQKPENLPHSQIVERLLEYKDTCKDLEIFTKDLNLQPLQQHKNTRDTEFLGAIEDNSGSGQGNINGICAKETFIKLKKSKYSIKTSNTKNGFNKYNKSVKAKFLKNQKKELNLNKKNSTAEPIIYLFALVFIYLLIKAASDINQHYKSQNKNDKRLRRCSLQSYAQIHRPDRRASKELALRQKQQQRQQRLRSLSRSLSYDHHQYVVDGICQKPEQLPIIKQHVAQSSSTVRTQITASNNWQLLRQHTTHSLDNSDITTASRSTTEFPSMMARRCSVPVALNYQRPKMTPLSTFNDASLCRRTSLASSSLQLSLDPIDSLAPENKRRVRMINRH